MTLTGDNSDFADNLTDDGSDFGDDGFNFDDADNGFEPPAAGEDEQSVLEKFGNDPAALARSYAELQRKLGAQGQELGMARQKAALFDEHLAARGGTPQEKPKSARESILERARAAQERGEDPLEAMVDGLLEATNKSVEERVQPLTQDRVRSEVEQIKAQFIQRNPWAAGLDQTAKQIFEENPGLLPLDKGREGIARGLAMLYREARYRAQSGRASRPAATLDNGRSAGARRGQPTRQVGGLQADIARARQTGRREDLTAIFGKIAMPVRED